MSFLTPLLSTAALLAVPVLSWAHGGTPRVTQITFPAQLDGGVWAITDNQGLYAVGEAGFNWLCEDAVSRNAGFQSAVLVGADDREWLVATNFGLFRSTDGGCNFEPADGPLALHIPLDLSANPENAAEVLTATQTPGVPNDVFRTLDGGRTWTPAGLDVTGIIHNILRAPALPTRIYVAHAAGAARSDDGGQTFVPISLGPAALDVAPEEFRLLAGHPTRVDELWATVERFPDSTVMRSQDGGETWTPKFTLADTPGAFVFDAEAGSALVVSRFDAWRRSDDGGETWRRAEETIRHLGCLTLEQRTGKLWGCSNVFFMGPWVLGTSGDFGETWAPALARFTDVQSQWGCPADAEATLACEGLCPGQAAGASCEGADAFTSPQDAGSDDLRPLRLDAGPIPQDGREMGPSDALIGDGARDLEDARVTPPATASKGSDGCTLHAGRGGAPLWLLLAGTALALRRRRRSQS